MLLEIINNINEFLWTYIVITMLVVCALYFTIGLRGMQFVRLREMWRCLIGKGEQMPEEETTLQSDSVEEKKQKKITPFQAFAVALSSRVGTGNLAGVASAIAVGGPGAVFWMWVMALLGSATAFVEATLAQMYKRRGEDCFFGGPAYYMQYGLGHRWMGIIFSVLLVVTFGMANQSVQSTTISDALADAFSMDKSVIGVVITLMAMTVVFGGVQRVSRFAAVVVPVMAVGYIILALFIFVTNITAIPEVLKLIVEHAFGIQQAAGGAVGVAVIQGVKRGLFSNEAGEGSAPNAAATATTSHPVRQGFIQALGVFVDTLVICSCTAFIILVAGNYDSGADGILLTADSLELCVGSAGRWFLTTAIFLFAFSTIIANCLYGELNIRFITHKRWAVQVFRLISCGMVLFGAFVDLQTTWSIVDLAMGLMTICNLIAIFLLFPKVRRLYNDFMEHRRKGINPRYRWDNL